MARLSESAVKTCVPLRACLIESQVRVYCCHLLEGEHEAKCSHMGLQEHLHTADKHFTVGPFFLPPWK